MKKNKHLVSSLGTLALVFFQGVEIVQAAPLRNVISLDGEWQVAEGTLAQVPVVFDHAIPVPGLLDMAKPAFESPGSTVAQEDRGMHWLKPADPRREAFWYRRTFRVERTLPAVALLKIHKAAYGTKVILNGQVVGEHGPNFSPGWFDVRPYLKADGLENELVIRVGASLAQVPIELREGWDYEKARYVPGIYDSVELILSGTPHVINVQTVPDIEKRAVRAVIELGNAGSATAKTHVQGTVREAKSGRIVGETTVAASVPSSGTTNKVELTIAIPKGHLWTPEDPFLYELEVNTGADLLKTRFGLRSFTTDPATGHTILNGKPYFLRGASLCIFRFLEDPEHRALPWDRQWVRKLHQRCKEMHWNALRYCIGFPPERWYEIADEEGLLIQDEFPIWYNKKEHVWPEASTTNQLAAEFTEWMRERWNHPCVVIWDAQNETRPGGAITGQTLQMVRDLDLSHRPWDNGWGPVQQPGDITECHPYRANREGFTLARLLREPGFPYGKPKEGDPLPVNIINEYGWLWLNRDGTPTTLTEPIYQRLLGANSTVEQRRIYYARMLAGMTEFWRVHRKCAGVLYFCCLGYSRPVGQTSDNWIDVKNLVFEPNYYRYVRDAFMPIGLMLNLTEDQFASGKPQTMEVLAINDLYKDWQGSVRLRLLQGDKVLQEKTQTMMLPALGQGTLAFTVDIPATAGNYQAEATLLNTPDGDVHSLRDFVVLSPEEIAARAGIAIGKHVMASSSIYRAGAMEPEAVVDGNPDTRWSSAFSDPQWLAIDLGAVTKISRVELVWDAAYGKSYAIQISTDGKNWTDVYKTTAGKGGTEIIRFAPVDARWVRYFGTKRATAFGHSLWEFRVFPPLLAFPDLENRAAATQEAPLFRNPQAPLEQRVENLLQQLTLEEKTALCSGDFTSGGVPRLGIAQLAVLDGRQGVRPMDKKGTKTTLLPCTLALSCTWDEKAAEEFSGVLAEEMLSLKQHVLLAPMINLVRSPLGGRNFENFGEDPLLAGRMAAAYVRGTQTRMVGACACLLAGNDCEAYRHFTSANMDERALREVHLIPTELSFRDGGVWTMMSANSLLNGVHCGQNRRLLQEIVKDQFGFDGVMITDWRAAYDTVPTALAGTDITTGYCKYVFGENHLLQAVSSGRVTQALLDDKVRRILRLYIRSGVLDPDFRAQGEVDSPRHRELARELATQSMVLLKNDRHLLPLDAQKIRRVLVTGPAADAVLQGGGSGSVPAAINITPLQGLQAAWVDTNGITFLPFSVALEPRLKKGSLEWDPQTTGKMQNGNGRTSIAELTQAAKAVDAVIFYAAGTVPSEGHDQTNIDLPGGQNEAIAALAKANPNIVVVLVANGAVTVEPWLEQVPALLAAHYAGEATGAALADVLTGKVNPSGKLSYTFGKQLSDYPCHALGEWPAKPALKQSPVNPGMTAKDRKAIHGYDTDYHEGVLVGYRWFDAKDIAPLFPFGYGLSYTTFTLSNLNVGKTDNAVHVMCTIKNTGDRAGAEVVQVYVAPPKSSVPRPPKELKGFAKVMLQPGEARQVEIALRPSALAFFDVASNQWKIEAGDYEILVGCSSRDIRLRAMIKAEEKLIKNF